MSVLPAAAQGAIYAAVITSVIAFSGFLITKDTKVSDLRQQWIDGLRSDLADYVSSIWTIYNVIKIKGWPAGSESVISELSKLERLYVHINLRLNPADSRAILLRAEMDNLTKLIETAPPVEYQKMAVANQRFERIAGELLKTEWERVKTGEPFYQFARAFMLVVLVAGSILILVRGGS